MDGVGIRKSKYGNAVKAANTKMLDYLLDNYPNCLLEASGKNVGLPQGQMGNSEVGHTNIGAGRIVYQALEKITKELETKEIYNNVEINNVIEHTKENNSSLHLLGLLSDGGIHSDINHLLGLIDLCKEKEVKKLYIHVFTDGRDTDLKSGINYLKKLTDKLEKEQIGKIASISGRYYSMDRDNNWNRIKKSYDVIVNGLGEPIEPLKYLEECYAKDETDEFITPALIDKDGIIKDNDGLLVFNFRPDRLRELFKVITNKEFKEFSTKELTNIKLVTMMPVSDEVICTNAYKIEEIDNSLGEYLSNKGIKQLRIAETEKYAHVTYFFDGGVERELNNCDRILIPSPKVETYDLKPEMSAYEITEKVLSVMDKYEFIVLNFANGDMVGHTGVFDKTVKAVEVVDECLEKIYKKSKELGFTLIVTADHGNSDYMLDDKGNVVTSHSVSPVPFIITDEKYNLKDGNLSDIAPTILDIMNVDIPEEMTGNILTK